MDRLAQIAKTFLNLAKYGATFLPEEQCNANFPYSANNVNTDHLLEWSMERHGTNPDPA
jgi:hypothetical protein